jgi:hypothetical protein
MAVVLEEGRIFRHKKEAPEGVWGIDKKLFFWNYNYMMNAMKSFTFKFSSPKAIAIRIHSDCDPGGAV